MALALEVIQPHPTWDILDSSKLTTYMECPRKFFYRYMLGWRPDWPNNHLIFGSAWHLAMEHLLINGHSNESVAEAQILCGEFYRKYFPPDTDELYEPKTLLNAFSSIEDYAKHYAPEEREYEVLYTELAGLVLVSPERTMVFKCDAILRDLVTGAICGRDHKTSQRRYNNWGEHWILSTQMLTYLHALYCLYPDSETLKMWVRCSFFYSIQKKTGLYRPTEFADHPIDKSLSQMETWLTNINTYIDQLDDDMRVLQQQTTDDYVMQAFPMRTTSCFNYGRQCEFFDFCNAWSNPITRCEQTPIGFNVEWWDPMARPEIRTKLNLATQSGEPVEMDGE